MHKEENLPLVKVEALSKERRHKIIFENVNLELKKGEVLGLIGLSGSGKTTFLRVLTGLEPASSGRVQFLSKNKTYVSSLKHSDYGVKLFGYAFQDSSFYPELSIIENLLYFASLLKIEKKEALQRAHELLAMLELSTEKESLGRNLSEGMKKRLDLACALIHNPQILLLDEATANLDLILRKDLLGYIKKIKKKGVSIIFVSHYLDEIQEIADSVLIINKGTIKRLKDTKQVEHHFMEAIHHD